VRALIERRQDRWPPPNPISPEGRIAGLTTTGCVIVSALAWLVVLINLAVCTKHCDVEPGLAGLVMIPVALTLVAAVALGYRTLVRPTDPEAGTAWRFGLSVIFFLGVLAAASGIPNFTCPPGTQLSFFGFCAGPHGTRLDAAEWRWLRLSIDAVGFVVACTAIRSRRWVDVMAPIAGFVWLGGTGALLVRIFVLRA
jgi:hypothetical protein